MVLQRFARPLDVFSFDRVSIRFHTSYCGKGNARSLCQFLSRPTEHCARGPDVNFADRILQIGFRGNILNQLGDAVPFNDLAIVIE